MGKTRFDITSASDTSIGFDYQFYYFMYLVLGLRHNEKIGIEIKDDIHVELQGGDLVLIQTKHTIQTKKDNSTINLTERDKDLWKTINNWVKIINENPDSNSFIQKTKFQLVSNKSIFKNPFIINVQKLTNNDISIKEFKEYLDSLTKDSTETVINVHINTLKSLSDDLLIKFIKKIDFKLNEDNIIDRIKERIKEKYIEPKRVDDVFNNLFSELKTEEYLTIKDGKKSVLSFEDFVLKFGKCFRVGMSNILPIRTFEVAIPSKIENQKFILQLIDIGDIGSNDKDEMIGFTIEMLQLINNIKKWEEEGDIVNYEIENFNRQSVLAWKNSFREKFRQIKVQLNKGEKVDESEIKYKAIECLDEMRKQILKIDETFLSIELSNGQFYYLTNNQQIGWHYDWESRY